MREFLILFHYVVIVMFFRIIIITVRIFTIAPSWQRKRRMCLYIDPTKTRDNQNIKTKEGHGTGAVDND